jgi:RNA polymerase sigma-70 factor (ECF subfamily)
MAGKVPAIASPLHGRDRVARTFVNWFRVAARLLGVSLRPVEVNGGPGAVIRDEQKRLLGVRAFDVAGGQITKFSSIAKPDKLARLGSVGDVRSLPRSVR